MKHKKSITLLALIIVILSVSAATVGIVSQSGPGPFEYETVRGETVTIYGYGVYRHMSADVAIQGIAQDYITLFAAVPVLLIALAYSRRGSLRGKLVLAGTLGYF
ncbi:MAG: hypothetical protein ACLFQX_02030, partial [Candidatus Kapaibacterium sp.]